MAKKLTILIIAFIFLASCTTAPPARFEKDFYVYPAHDFSVRIPEGWHKTETLPDWMNTILLQEQRQDIRIMFFNNTTNGMIVITSAKTIWSYDIVTIDPLKSIKNINQVLENGKKEILKDPQCKSFNYEVIGCNRWNEDASFSNDFMKLEYIAKGYMYSCRKDDTCVLKIIMVSRQETFDKNKYAFFSLVDSFQNNPFYKHYFYD